MYNLLLAVVIFLSHSRLSFRNLEQNALLNVFQNNISKFPLCRTFLKSVLFLGRTKAILNFFFFFEKNLSFSHFCPLCDPSPFSDQHLRLACLQPFPLCPLNSVKANRLTLHSGRFAKVLGEGIESHLLGFHFHKHGSLLAVSPNFAVLGEFVQQTSSLEHVKTFGQKLRFNQHLCSPLWPKPYRDWHVIFAVYPEGSSPSW